MKANYTIRKFIGIFMMAMSLLLPIMTMGIIGISILAAVTLPPLFFWILPLIIATSLLCFSIGNAIFEKARNDALYAPGDGRFFMAENRQAFLHELFIAPFVRVINLVTGCFSKKEDYKSHDSIDFNLDCDEDSSNEEIQSESPTENTSINESVPSYLAQESSHQQSQIRFG